MPARKKSPDAYRTISEAAAEADLPAHVLRFWESKFSQLKPLKRNGGRRLYRPQDIDLLKGLRRLLYEEGYTIKGAQKYLRENGVASVAEFGSGAASIAEASKGSEAGSIPAQASEQAAETGQAPQETLESRSQTAGEAGLDAHSRARIERVIGRLSQARKRLDEALAS